MSRPAFGAQAVTGALQLASSGFLSQAVGLLAHIVVARFVSPSQYGAAAVALSVTAFFSTTSDLGVSPAIASGRLAERHHLSAVFLISTGVGFCMGGALFLSAGRIEQALEFPGVESLLQVAAITLVASFSAASPRAILRSQGRFAVLAAMTLVTQLLVAVSAMGLAYRGAGALALVVPSAIGAVFTLLWSMFLCRKAVSAAPSTRGLGWLLAEAAQLLSYTSINVGARHLDNILIAVWLPPEQLGIYAFAYSLLTKVLALVASPVAVVFVPMIGRVRDEPERLGLMSSRVFRVSLLAFSPIFLGASVLAPDLLTLLYGSTWQVAIPLAQVFFVVGLAQIVTSLSGSLWAALGYSRLLMLWAFSVVPVLGLGFVVGAGVFRSVLAVAVIYAGLSAGFTVAALLVSRRLIKISVRAVATTAGVALSLSALMVAVVLVLGLALSEQPLPVKLALQLAVAVLSYVLGLRFLAPTYFLELQRLTPRRLLDRIPPRWLVRTST